MTTRRTPAVGPWVTGAGCRYITSRGLGRARRLISVRVARLSISVRAAKLKRNRRREVSESVSESVGRLSVKRGRAGRLVVQSPLSAPTYKTPHSSAESSRVVIGRTRVHRCLTVTVSNRGLCSTNWSSAARGH